MGAVIDISDFVWTIAVLIMFLMVMIVVPLDAIARHASVSDPFSPSVVFVKLNAQPYTLLSVMMNARAAQDSNAGFERSEFEKLFQESVHPGSALFSNQELMSFLGDYDLRQYLITSSGQYLAGRFVRCGQNLEGFCSDQTPDKNRLVEIGARKIDDVGLCPGNFLPVRSRYGFNYKEGNFCYVENVDENGNRLHDPDEQDGYSVVACGAGGKGVCASECMAGRLQAADSSECRQANSGNTRACCLPIDKANIDELSRERVASVPLLYKRVSSDITVTTYG